MYLSFLVYGEEIVALYDPSHLLKGIRNNLLTNKAKFTWKQNREQIACWEDIIKLYEMDNGDYDTRMLNRLTDSHVYP